MTGTADVGTAAAPSHSDEVYSENTVSKSDTETESQFSVDALPVVSSSSSTPQHWVTPGGGSTESKTFEGTGSLSRETSTVTPLSYDACGQQNTIGQ